MSATRPNIVLIVADDLGYSDLGCYGGEVETPHLDALADGGVRLSSFYNCARCCPSRASILTGVHPHTAGIGHMTRDLGHPSYRGRLSADTPTIAEMLRVGGYSTHMVGKWHVGGDHPWPGSSRRGETRISSAMPLGRGFNTFYGTLAGAGSYYEPHTLTDGANLVESASLPDDFYYTDAIGRRAVEVVRRAAKEDQPFFLYLAHVAPHWPLHAREADIARFRDRYSLGWDELRARRHERCVDLGLIDSRWQLSPRDPYAPPWESAPAKEWEVERMATYAAQIYAMDRTIGDVVAALKETDAFDNTFIAFISDNGGCSELLREDETVEPPVPYTRHGEKVRFGNRPDITPGPANTFLSYGLAWANLSNAPFRLYKHWVHEGGIASPCVLSWPAMTTAPGSINHSAAHVIDLAATFCDLAGVDSDELREGKGLPGTSLSPVVGGGSLERRQDLAWEHEGNRAVRADRWKLVAERNGPWQLHDMRADRTELTDLAAEHPTVVSDLAERYEQWANDAGVVPFEIVDEWLQRDLLGSSWCEMGRPS